MNFLFAEVSEENFLSSELLVQNEPEEEDRFARYTLELEELSEGEVSMHEEIWDTDQHPFLFLHGDIYEEVTIQSEFPRLSPKIMAAVLAEGDIMLPVYELFRILQLKVDFNIEGDTLQGYFLNEDRPFLISEPNHQIIFEEDTFDIDERDLVRTRRDIFLHRSILEAIFDITSDFNIRQMKVEFDFEDEMPYQRQLRLSGERDNQFRTSRGLPEADTTVGRSHPFFNFGTLDWSLYSLQEIGGNERANVRVSPGGQLLGGSFDADIYYDSDRPFRHRDQSYKWEYVDNESEYLRQINVGKGGFGSLSSIRGDVIGASFTNRPTYQQQHFSTYTISDYTEPNWTVEVYRDNRLIDYTETDESGYYEFDIPISYGSNNIQLRFYGPHGESRTDELDINIPFQFTPKGKLEYKASGGISPNSLHREPGDPEPVFGNVNANYGISHRISIGGGVEYFSVFDNHPIMPYGNINATLNSHLMLNARYMHGVKSSVTGSYRSPGGINIQGGFKDYEEGQEAFISNYTQERFSSVSLPFRIGSTSHMIRGGYSQYLYPELMFNVTNASYQFGIGRFRVNNSFSVRWRDSFEDARSMTGIFSLSYNLRRNWRLNTRTHYNFTREELMTTNAGLSRSFKNSTLSLEVGRSFSHSQNRASISYRYNFDFANVAASGRMVDDQYLVTQQLSGGIMMDAADADMHFNNRSQTRSAGIKLVPFVDLDGNGIKDPDDPALLDLDVNIRRGDVRKDTRDSVIRITGLLPYENYFIDLDMGLNADISWNLLSKTMNITTDKNGYKKVYVPVQVMGEVTGSVTREIDGEIRGQERIEVYFEHKETGQIYNDVMTEMGGQYNYFGLPAGSYNVFPNPEQLERLGLQTNPSQREIHLEKGRVGDYIMDVDFHLTPADED